jgi:hypothetical protein
MNMADEPKLLRKLSVFIYGALAATLYVVAGWRVFRKRARPRTEFAASNISPALPLATSKNIEEDAAGNASAAPLTTEGTGGTKVKAPGIPAAGDIRLPPGWHKPQPEKLPEPTYWPAVLAFAMVLFAWGWVTDLYISVIGFVLSGVALAGWIGDLRHEANT